MTNKENNIKINNKIEDKNNNKNNNENILKNQKVLKLNPKFIKIDKNSTNQIQSKIKNEKKNVIDKSLWIPDNIVDYCYNCDKQFTTILNRKHHCRICGKIFCSNCLNKFLDINIYNEKSEIKVCSACQQNYSNLIKILVNNLIEYKDNDNKLCFETKLENYIKNNINNKSIILSNDNSEKNYDKILHNIYNYLADNIIKKILEDNNISQKYINIIPNIVKKVIENIQPSIEYLKDNININNYIKKIRNTSNNINSQKNNNIYNEIDVNKKKIIKQKITKNILNKIIEKKNIKLRNLLKSKIIHGSKQPLFNSYVNSNNVLNNNLNNNIRNNLTLLNENLNQTQQIKYIKRYKNNTINKKLLNYSQNNLPSTGRSNSNIKNLKFILTTPRISQKKKNEEITQRNINNNINTLPNNYNGYENIQFNIFGNNKRHLYPQLAKNHPSLIKK